MTQEFIISHIKALFNCNTVRIYLRAVLSLCVVASLLAGMVLFVKSTHGLFSGKASAAIPRPEVLAMGEAEKRRYAADLRALLASDASHFGDLLAADVLLVLQEPQLRRREGPVEMWQYLNNDCALDLYMKNEQVAGQSAGENYARIIHHEIRRVRVARLLPAAKAEEADEAEPDEGDDGTACLRALIGLPANTLVSR